MWLVKECDGSFDVAKDKGRLVARLGVGNLVSRKSGVCARGERRVV